MTAKKLGALTRMSTDLSEDAIINIADDLADEMVWAFAKKEDECGIDGDGTLTYGGMTGIRTKMVDGAHAGSFVAGTSPSDNWSEITIAGGNNARDMGEGATAKYAGYPIVESAAMPTADAAAALNGVVQLWFGDLKKSTTFGDRRGITIKVSTDRYIEYDQIAIQATERFCIVNHDIGGAAGVYGPVRGLTGTS